MLDGDFRQRWLAERPEYVERMRALQRDLLRIEHPQRAAQLDRLDAARPVRPSQDEAGYGLGLGL